MKEVGASLGDDTTICMTCLEAEMALRDALKVAERRARRYRKERNTAREELSAVKETTDRLQRKVNLLLG